MQMMQQKAKITQEQNLRQREHAVFPWVPTAVEIMNDFKTLRWFQSSLSQEP